MIIKMVLLTAVLVAIVGLAGPSNAGYKGYAAPSYGFSYSPAPYENPGINIPQPPISYLTPPIPDLNPPPVSDFNQQPGFGFHAIPGPIYGPPAPPVFPSAAVPTVGEPR